MAKLWQILVTHVYLSTIIRGQNANAIGVVYDTRTSNTDGCEWGILDTFYFGYEYYSSGLILKYQNTGPRVRAFRGDGFDLFKLCLPLWRIFCSKSTPQQQRRGCLSIPVTGAVARCRTPNPNPITEQYIEIVCITGMATRILF